MLLIVFIGGVVCTEADAITWDFDGSRQGWAARESFTSGGINRTSLDDALMDGVWRVLPRAYEGPGRLASIELISPYIGADSGLFDRLIVRARVVHPEPAEGWLTLAWTNPVNVETPGFAPDGFAASAFWIQRPQVFEPDWHQITVEGIDQDPGSVWQDTLIDLRLHLTLAERPQGPEDVPSYLEIDWITLTGRLEEIEGELPPPKVDVEPVPGDLLGSPEFFSLELPGLGSFQYVGNGALGDIDGDGDLDLAAVWQQEVTEGETRRTVQGWMTALNDGSGGYERGRVVTLESRAVGSGTDFLQLYGEDVDNDGLMDVMLVRGTTIETWYNDAEGGFVAREAIQDAYWLGMADVDGDGAEDLVMRDAEVLREGPESQRVHVVTALNDGTGSFGVKETWVLPSVGRFPVAVLEENGVDVPVGVLWAPDIGARVGSWLLTEGFDISGFEQPTSYSFPVLEKRRMLCFVGDVDQDGRPDLMLAKQVATGGGGPRRMGLEVVRATTNGGVRREELYDRRIHLVHDVAAWDLDGDGTSELAFANANEASGPSVVVLSGRQGEAPVEEGQYRIDGTGTGQILAGDVDGDGDTDLVVLEPSHMGGGGVFVLRNRIITDPSTVVKRVGAPSLVGFTLRPNYPDPFNADTVIRFDVDGVSMAVPAEVGVYDALGRLVRTVFVGMVGPGRHDVMWDSRDGSGRGVATGVYFCRVAVAGEVQTERMIKIK